MTCQDSYGNGARPSKIPLKRNPKWKSLVNIFNIFTGLRRCSSISAGEAVAVPQVWTSPVVRCRCRRESGPPALGCSGWDWDHHASAQIECRMGRQDNRRCGTVERDGMTRAARRRLEIGHRKVSFSHETKCCIQLHARCLL